MCRETAGAGSLAKQIDSGASGPGPQRYSVLLLRTTLKRANCSVASVKSGWS
jgi:hypothetical protein